MLFELDTELFSYAQVCMVCEIWRVIRKNWISHLSQIELNRPPHQIMAWVGLERYGYLEEAQRLAYRWIYM